MQTMVRVAVVIAGLLALLAGIPGSARAETVVLTCSALTTNDNNTRTITGRYVTRINTDAGTYTTDGTDVNISGRAVVTDQHYLLYYEYPLTDRTIRGHYQIDRYTGNWYNCFDGQSTCSHAFLGRSTCQREERRL